MASLAGDVAAGGTMKCCPTPAGRKRAATPMEPTGRRRSHWMAEVRVAGTVGLSRIGCLGGDSAMRWGADTARTLDVCPFRWLGVLPTPITGHCRLYRTAEALVMRAVGRVGVGCVGGGAEVAGGAVGWSNSGPNRGGTLGAAAACGPLAPTVLAHPCRPTISAMRPARAAVAALGIGGRWPHPRRRGPVPWAAVLRHVSRLRFSAPASPSTSDGLGWSATVASSVSQPALAVTMLDIVGTRRCCPMPAGRWPGVVLMSGSADTTSTTDGCPLRLLGLLPTPITGHCR